jgi:hypothetical protein
MPGAAAFLAALLAALGHPAPHSTVVRLALVPQAAHLQVAKPVSRPSRTHSCSTTQAQSDAAVRKLLPVACEQPPRANVALPNAATSGLSSLFGR